MTQITERSMHHKMRRDVLALCDAYASAVGEPPWRICRAAAKGDSAFYDDLRLGARSLTGRKYDETVLFFHVRWPAGLPWPEGVERPSAQHSTSTAA